VSKSWLRDKIEDLEAKFHPSVKEEDPPEVVMETLIRAEWLRRWEGSSEECIEAGVDDLIARLKNCSATREYGALMEIYRDVLIDVARRPSSTSQSDGDEYESAW
jgi:hypothetical protein